jgi:hypothetical protein
MAPQKKTPELDVHHVLQSVVLYVALARRWLISRDAEAAELLAPIVAAARADSRDRDETFVVDLHNDLTDLYRAFQKGQPETEEGRGHMLRGLFETHQIGLSDDDVATLDIQPDEIHAAFGPADAARENLAKVLRIAPRTIASYRARLGMVVRSPKSSVLDGALALESRDSNLSTYQWRETLRATRAVHFLLVNFLGGTPETALTLLKAWRRRSDTVP